MSPTIDYGALFSTVGDTVTSAIGTIVPIALGVFAIIYAVRKGIQLFRSAGR